MGIKDFIDAAVEIITEKLLKGFTGKIVFQVNFRSGKIMNVDCDIKSKLEPSKK